MRIVAGRFKGRQLTVPEGNIVRPTSDRARESLFNMLIHTDFGGDGRSPLNGAHILDCFAGSGALGLEALSRGASSAVFMEQDKAALGALQANIANCKAIEASKVIATSLPKITTTQKPCDLIFMDPPYGQELVAPTLEALATAGWLSTGTVAVIETEKTEALEWPSGWDQVKERRVGRALIRFGVYVKSQ